MAVTPTTLLKQSLLEDIVKRGILVKRGTSWKSWKSRIVILTHKSLFYFDSEDAIAHAKWKGELRCVDMTGVEAIPAKEAAGKENAFRIITAHRYTLFLWSFCFASAP